MKNCYNEVLSNVATAYDAATGFIKAEGLNTPVIKTDMKPLLEILKCEPSSQHLAKKYGEAMLDDCPYRSRSTLAKLLLSIWLIKKPKQVVLPNSANALIRQHGWLT
jgi:hypothetical protein